MKRIDVRLISAEVQSYNARDEHLEIKILLNDGKDKALIKQLHLDNPNEQAGDLFKEIRERLKKAHETSSTSDDLLGSVIHVRWMQDEEIIHERLARFLAALREKIKNGKRKGISYYDVERQMMNASTKFD